jgi:hypothetical protein
LFKTLTTTMSQRFPATTRSNPEELRRLLNAAGSTLRIIMPLTELEELIEAVLGYLNGIPHGGLRGAHATASAGVFCSRSTQPGTLSSRTDAA